MQTSHKNRIFEQKQAYVVHTQLKHASHLFKEVNESINLGYSQDQGYS